jgi:hypothetical protein
MEKLCPIIDEPEKRIIKTAIVTFPVGGGPATASAKPTIPAGWKEFVSAEGKYSVAFPEGGKPVQREDNASGFLAKTIGVDKADGTTIIITYSDLPVAFTGDQLEKALDGSRDGMTKSIPGAKVINESKTTVEGIPAREVTIAHHGGTMRSRMFQSGQRLYILAIGGPEGKVSDADIKTFFDSFRLTK